MLFMILQVFLRRPLDGAIGQCDICFVKKDGFLKKSNEWK
jgi:hypothetical protein